MRVLALVVVVTVWVAGCTGDPDVVADEPGHHFQIRSFSPGGGIGSIAGSGNLGIPVNGPAVQAEFSHIADLLLDGTGGLYVAAWHNSFVLRIDLTSGELTRIAGMGTRTKYTGDGGPALAADLSMPETMVLRRLRC